MRVLISFFVFWISGCSDSSEPPNSNPKDIGTISDAAQDAAIGAVDAGNDAPVEVGIDVGMEVKWISGDPSTLNNCDTVCEDAGLLCEEGSAGIYGGGLRAEYDDDSKLVMSCEELPPATTGTFDGTGTANLVAYSCRCVTQ